MWAKEGAGKSLTLTVDEEYVIDLADSAYMV